MVGIAGEDDLDAPVDATSDPAAPRPAAGTGQDPNSDPAPLRQTQRQTGNGVAPPIQAKLGAEEFAVIRAEQFGRSNGSGARCLIEQKRQNWCIEMMLRY
jgi:hypothetical protein